MGHLVTLERVGTQCNHAGGLSHEKKQTIPGLEQLSAESARRGKPAMPHERLCWLVSYFFLRAIVFCVESNHFIQISTFCPRVWKTPERAVRTAILGLEQKDFYAYKMRSICIVILEHTLHTSDTNTAVFTFYMQEDMGFTVNICCTLRCRW